MNKFKNQAIYIPIAHQEQEHRSPFPSSPQHNTVRTLASDLMPLFTCIGVPVKSILFLQLKDSSVFHRTDVLLLIAWSNMPALQFKSADPQTILFRPENHGPGPQETSASSTTTVAYNTIISNKWRELEIQESFHFVYSNRNLVDVFQLQCNSNWFKGDDVLNSIKQNTKPWISQNQSLKVWFLQCSTFLEGDKNTTHAHMTRS